MEAEPDLDPDELVRRSVRANIVQSAEHLRSGSELLSRRIASGDLVIVGAEYLLDTGVVEFFDGLSELG